MSSKKPKEVLLNLTLLWGFLGLLRMSALHPMAVVTFVVALIAFKFRDSLELTNRQLGIASLVILLGNLAFHRTVESHGHFMGIGSIAFAIWMSWMAILFLLVRRRENLRFARHACAACLLIACCMGPSLVVVAPIALVATVLITLGMREGQGLRVGAAQVAPMLFIIIFSGGLVTAATLSETRLGYLLRLFSIVPVSGIKFPPNASLDALQRWNSSDLVVLRVRGKEPPPYLVGRTYDSYGKNFWRWRNTKEELRSTEKISVDTASGPQELPLIFPYGKKIGEPGEPVTIEYPGGGKGYTIYAPRQFYGVASTLPRIHRYSSGRLEELAKDYFDGVYHLFPFKDGWRSPVQLDKKKWKAATPIQDSLPPELATNLHLPNKLSPIVAKLAYEVAGSQTDPEKKAAFITSFLQNKFTYGYEYPFDKKGDALEEFLRDRPPAHCEFFATSAALMLRTLGVPTRYVTGFVVQEKSADDEYYVVRLKHAHAWIEVWLPEKGWVIYDPTPPGVLGEPDDGADILHAITEWMANRWRKFIGLFSLSPKEMWARFIFFLKSLSWTHLLILVALVGLYRALKAYLIYLRKKRAKVKAWSFTQGRHDELTPMLERLQDDIEPLEWRREHHETTSEWLSRLAASDATPEAIAKTKEFLDSYESHRYSGQFSEEQKAALENQLMAVKSLFKGKSLVAKNAD